MDLDQSEFKKHIRYRRTAQIMSGAMLSLGVNPRDYDLSSIVGYHIRDCSMFPGNPDNVPNGWTCFIRENSAEIFEIPSKANHQGLLSGVFMAMVHYLIKDEYVLVKLTVRPADGWFTASYHYYDAFVVVFDRNLSPIIKPYGLNGTFDHTWKGKFDSSHMRGCAYAALKPNQKYSYHNELQNGSPYVKPSRRERVKIYHKSNKNNF
jgi:hypothetical protein